jgi:hypothetical protein
MDDDRSDEHKEDPRPPAEGGRPARTGPAWRWYLLLVPPFVGTLWVPFYNSVEPRLGNVPFFYWYQLAWIVGGAVLTATVYFATREDG